MSESGIFQAAVKLPAEKRAAYLNRACSDDSALRNEVDSVLEAHEAPGSFRGPLGAGGGLTEDYQPIPEGPGTVVGPYKLLQQIGEGGMGTVFMAEQTKPVRRMVALKIIKPGMDSSQVIARFEAERQALALMDHPNIAKVFDAGTTEDGLPYFVMELVKGVPITRFCDENQLTRSVQGAL
jgi:serine/threonine protein kinase